jgi:ABC-2 type transport system ATP-binding protein
MWDFIQGVREKGKTIFLTTHYMEEAERLCDRVGIMDQGRLVALDSPKDLIQGISAESKVTFTSDRRAATEEIGQLESMNRLEWIGDKLILYTNDSGRVLEELVTLSHKKGWELIDLNVEKPNLEDVFLTLTGKEIRD